MLRLLKYHLFLITLGFCSHAISADHYVDNQASGNNDGSSWENAWQSFSSIQWSQLQPGDILYLSGGSSGKTYKEQMTVGSSGTSGNPIVITKGIHPGHDGELLIDGEYQRYGIFLNGVSYITIQNICFDRNIQSLRIGHGTGIVVDNIESNIQRGRGISCHDISNSIIKDCTIISDIGSFPYQTDGIYCQYGSNNIFEDNYILIRNSDPDEHCDGIQIYEETNPTIRNNYIAQDVTNPSHSNGIWSSAVYGTYSLYNNIFYTPTFHTWSNTFGYLEYAANANAQLRIYNNVFYGGTNYNLLKIDDRDAIIKNNIFVSTNADWSVYIENALSTNSNLDYNLYYFPNSDVIVYYQSMGVRTLTQLQTSGVELNGKTGDPLFVNASNGNFELRENSPAIDAGVDLGYPYNRDKDGVSRPQGNRWDMGVYETSGTIPPPPSAPQNLRLKN